MTILVGIRCTDGIVIGADGSMTLVTAGRQRTIEQPTKRKILVVDDDKGFLVLAGSGAVGDFQRFAAEITGDKATRKTRGKQPEAIGKSLMVCGRRAFVQSKEMVEPIELSALVGCMAHNNQPTLIELQHGSLKPEIKNLDDAWYVSLGSGQPIVDPFLALLRDTLLGEDAPNLRLGVFAAYWALEHACEVNPGGIDYPIQIAVIEEVDGSWGARMLDEQELDERKDIVDSAKAHLAEFRAIVERGREDVSSPRPEG